MKVEERIAGLKAGQELRKNLIELKQELKEEAAREEILTLLEGDYSLFTDLLENPEPKVRKNAAMVLGRLKADENVPALYQAYEREQQRFVKSDYLKALAQLDYGVCAAQLAGRLAQLEAYHPTEEEEKHVREELQVLRRLVDGKAVHERHCFQAYDRAWEVILTTGKKYQQVTAGQVPEGKVTILKSGVRVYTSQLRSVIRIPTYRELLFPLDRKKIPGDFKGAAKALAESNLSEFLEKAHGAKDGFYFRMSLQSPKPLSERSLFVKKCSFALEQEMGGKLKNSVSDYELELRLIENREGEFLPLVKLYTLEEERFSYRKNTVSTSIRPEQAALLARLAKPYMAEQAQVLDPFCGVGTMLIERDRAYPARVMYGIDIFGEAIAKAKENTALAHKEVYYITRDFFDFTHKYLFDEIFTNMPERGKKSREEQDALYAAFFDKAGEILRRQGRMFLYSREKNYVKKQLRLHKEFTLLREFSMDEKDNYYLFIISY